MSNLTNSEWSTATSETALVDSDATTADASWGIRHNDGRIGSVARVSCHATSAAAPPRQRPNPRPKRLRGQWAHRGGIKEATHRPSLRLDRFDVVLQLCCAQNMPQSNRHRNRLNSPTHAWTNGGAGADRQQETTNPATSRTTRACQRQRSTTSHHKGHTQQRAPPALTQHRPISNAPRPRGTGILWRKSQVPLPRSRCIARRARNKHIEEAASPEPTCERCPVRPACNAAAERPNK